MINYSSNDDWKKQLQGLISFISHWHGDLTSNDGILDKRIPDIGIPNALREFYSLVGNKEITAINEIIMPWNLRVVNEEITFYKEAQNICFWNCKLDNDNPSVIMVENGKRYNESESLVGFLFQCCIFEAIEGAEVKYCHKTYTSLEKIEKVLQLWRKVPLHPWSWPHYPTDFFYLSNALGMLTKNKNNEYYFQCGAHKKDELRMMEEFVIDNNNWEEVTLE